MGKREKTKVCPFPVFPFLPSYESAAPFQPNKSGNVDGLPL